MLGNGPHDLWLLAKERMRVAHAQGSQWYHTGYINGVNLEEIRIKKLSRLMSFQSDLDDQIIRKAAWNVLSGVPISLDDLERSVEHLQCADATRRLIAQEILELDDSGEKVRGVRGLTLVPTPWTVKLWTQLYAHSLKSALMWFRLLDERGDINGKCPCCKCQISLAMANGKLRKVRPRHHRSECLVDFWATSNT